MSGLGELEADLGTGFNNIVHAQLGENITINAEWADVPRGDELNWGTLTLRVVKAGAEGTSILREAVDPVGSFSGSRWTPRTPKRA